MEYIYRGTGKYALFLFLAWFLHLIKMNHSIERGGNKNEGK